MYLLLHLKIEYCQEFIKIQEIIANTSLWGAKLVIVLNKTSRTCHNQPRYPLSSMNQSSLSKKQLRRELLKQRQSLGEKTWQEKSDRLCENLQSLS